MTRTSATTGTVRAPLLEQNDEMNEMDSETEGIIKEKFSCFQKTTLILFLDIFSRSVE